MTRTYNGQKVFYPDPSLTPGALSADPCTICGARSGGLPFLASGTTLWPPLPQTTYGICVPSLAWVRVKRW